MTAKGEATVDKDVLPLPRWPKQAPSKTVTVQGRKGEEKKKRKRGRRRRGCPLAGKTHPNAANQRKKKEKQRRRKRKGLGSMQPRFLVFSIR